MKKQVIDVIKLLHQHQFHLAPLSDIAELVKTVFADNEDYFHILPQVIATNYYQEAILKGKPVLEVEETVAKVLEEIGSKATEMPPQGDAFYQERSIEEVVFKHFHPDKPLPINILQEYHNIQDYSQLYDILMKVNAQAKDTYKEFKIIVDQTRKQSHGIPYGLEIKIPTAEEVQFPVLLPVVASILGPENSQKVTRNIVTELHERLKAKFEQK